MPSRYRNPFAVLVIVLLAPQPLNAAAPATQPAHRVASSKPIVGQLVFPHPIVASTNPDAAEKADLRVYDLSNLLAAEHLRWRALRPGKRESRERHWIGGVISGAQGPPNMWFSEYDEAGIVKLIILTVAPDTWRENGGLNYIRAFNGRIWIEQTPSAHRQIERLLTALQETAPVKSTSNSSASDQSPRR